MKFDSLAARRGRALMLAGAGLMAVAVATPVYAQENASGSTQATVGGADCVDADADGVCDSTTDATNADGSQAAGGTIVVTGSRIRRPDNFTSSEPMTVITADSMREQGFTTTSDALQSAAVTQGTSQINNYYGGYVVNGGTGVNTIGLRGLGPARTLVLLDGHRLAPAGTRGAVGSVDLNTLPTVVVDRVEILKAGASSIYGSDAVAGVVNIITDTKLEGFKLDMQATVPEVGAGVDTRVSGAFGASGDRWNVVVAADWRKRRALRVGDESWASCPIGGYLNGVGTALGSGDYIDPKTGKPACWTLDNGGTTINTIGISTRPGVDRLTGAVGNYNRFVPDASNVAGPVPGYTGVDYYTRDSFDPEMLKEELITPVETINLYANATYDLQALGNAQLYSQFVYSNRKSSSSLYRQLILDYAVGSPLLPAQFRNTPYLNPTAVSNGQLVAARSFIGYGLLPSEQDVNFYRWNAGLRGDLGLGDFRYDLYGAYSWSNSSYTTGTFLTSRVAQSLDVVDNGDGTFSCADTSNGCVAAPQLNAASVGGNLSDAYRNFITANVVGHTKTQEWTGSLDVNGSLFSLPGGAAQLAAGVEYRHSYLNDQPPAESVAGDLYNLTSAAPTKGTDEVWEVYGELFLPLLSDVPGAYRLSLDGSGRYTHYRSYGGEWTYKGSIEYAPIRGITFRGSYGTSYRAPSLFEQYLGATTGFLSSSSDPCDDYANATSPTIQANCAAAGLPADFTQKNGVTVYSGGGAAQGLSAETSKNLSGGIVLQPVLPEALGKFSFSADYYSIEVNNGVSRLGASALLNLCYGAAVFNPNDGYCRFVSRDANDALTVYDSYTNIATDKVRGLEFNVSYGRDIGPGSLQIDALVSHYLEQSSKLFPTDALVDANNTATQPDWTATFNASYRVNAVTFHYGFDWIGKTTNTINYFATDSTTGVVDKNLAAYYADYYYFDTPNYWLHHASIQFDVQDKFEFTVGVRNIFNTKPPMITSGGFSVYGNAPLYSGYDYMGRTFYANVTAKF